MKFWISQKQNLKEEIEFSIAGNQLEKKVKNRQVAYIAPLNHLPLLSSDPGGVLQELAV